MKKIDFVLASASPRRRELLERLGVDFRVIVSDADENITDAATPADYVKQAAFRKGRAVLQKMKEDGSLKENTLILACDTVVVYDGMVIGKPRDEAHAVLTLSLLSDSWHTVCSGLYVYYDGREVSEAVPTRVKFRELSEEEILAYVRSGEPMGKAGSYAIQEKGSTFAERIEGEYSNVVGLPVASMTALLRQEFWLAPMDYIGY